MSSILQDKDREKMDVARVDHADANAPDANMDIDNLAALERPKALTRRMLRLYGILLLGYMCIILQGYDGSLMPAINGMVCLPFCRSSPFVQPLTNPLAAVPGILWLG